MQRQTIQYWWEKLQILLISHVDRTSHDIHFKPEPKVNTTKVRVWDIKKTKVNLGSRISDNLLFVHAILGCDTTSRVFGIGKPTALNKIRRSNHFVEISQIFLNPVATKDVIISAGEAALVCLYNGNKDEKLDDLCYRHFHEKVSKNLRYIEAKSLPPASAAAKFHSLRVYYQVQQWLGNAENMDPEEWGWHLSQCRLLPIKTDMPPASQELLRLFRCNCKTGCNNARCGCKKHGLECSHMCGECKGVSCMNSPKPQEQEESLLLLDD